MTRASILAASLLLLVAMNCLAQTKQWLTLPLGPAQDLVLESSGARTARIPVNYADGVAATTQLKVRLFDVSSKEGHGQKLAEQFTVTFVKANDTRDAAIEVIVADGAAEVLPGPHALSLRVATDFADPKTVQSLTITLTVPVPQLAVDPVVVGIERGFLLLPDTVNAGVLRVTEKTQKSPVNALEIAFTRDLVVTGQPDNGALSFGPGIQVVKPGAAASAPVVATGDFPPGKSTGKLMVASKDLAAPVSTTVEIRVHRSYAWIFILIAAGAAIGYFVRTHLASRKAMLEAAVVASAAVGLVRKELASTADATYRQELNAQISSMSDALRARKADEITKAAAKLQDDLVASRTRFEQRLQPLSQGAIALHALVDRKWTAPPYLLAQLDNLRQSQRDLVQLLSLRNADAATQLLEGAIADKLAATLMAMETAGANLGRLATTVTAHAPPMLDGDLKNLADAADTLARRFPWPAPDRIGVSTEQLLAALTSWTTQGSPVRLMLAQLPELVRSFLGWAEARLTRGGPDPQLQALAETTIAELQGARLSEQMDLADPDIPDLLARLLRLRDDWQQYLTAKAANASATAQIDDALRRSGWTAAIEAVRVASAPTPMGSGIVSSAPSIPPGSATPASDSLPQPKGSSLGFEPASLLMGTVGEREDLLAAAQRASWVQTAIVGLLFMIGVYCLYRETWSGSDKEMLALFVFAFGIDLTADNVLAAFKRLKLPDL